MLTRGRRGVSGRPALSLFLLAFIVAGAIGCEGADPVTGNDGELELPLRPRFPVDGRANLDGLPIVFDQEVPWRHPSGPSTSSSTTQVRVATMNDDQDLYVAVTWIDPTYDDQLDAGRADGIRLWFDSDGDGRVGAGDDVKVVQSAYDGSLFMDRHVDRSGADDGVHARTARDRTGDGLGRLSYDAARSRYTVEFLIPFGDDTNAEDGALSGSTPFAITLLDAFDGRVAEPHGVAAVDAPTDAWPTLDLRASTVVSRPSLPTDLTGLVVFLSEHDGSRRLYAYRPRSGDLRLIPIDPQLHVERVSLANGLNWIAMEASYSPDDRSTYEIFRVGTDGGQLEQLTHNDVFDGAPAWSRSDHRLAYHSEREVSNSGRPHASIVLMTPEGVELDDLSSDVVDERDPAYLDDGRIVIKTTRASPWPKYRLAALRESGTAFDILTEALGGTDHRPSALGPWVYYERFRSEGHFADDPGARTKPWDILSVHTLGGQGSTLVSDGWANRQPVPSPTGPYVAHLRQSGHSAIELVTWTGTYLGRLVPNITDIVQFDWK